MAPESWRTRFGERRAEIWVLLSDTDRFLSRARLLPRFENRLRDWRSRLSESPGNLDVARAVRDEIVAVRRSFREQGWELRLGSVDVVAKGFRSDDSTARGFRRMVLFLAGTGEIYYVVGEANHLELDAQLRRRLESANIRLPFVPHYLWYRTSAGVIELAGADTESRESFEDFKRVVEERKSDLVRALKKLA